jgi:hypothetical protein
VVVDIVVHVALTGTLTGPVAGTSFNFDVDLIVFVFVDDVDVFVDDVDVFVDDVDVFVDDVDVARPTAIPSA